MIVCVHHLGFSSSGLATSWKDVLTVNIELKNLHSIVQAQASKQKRNTTNLRKLGTLQWKIDTNERSDLPVQTKLWSELLARYSTSGTVRSNVKDLSKAVFTFLYENILIFLLYMVQCIIRYLLLWGKKRSYLGGAWRTTLRTSTLWRMHSCCYCSFPIRFGSARKVWAKWCSAFPRASTLSRQTRFSRSCKPMPECSIWRI